MRQVAMSLNTPDVSQRAFCASRNLNGGGGMDAMRAGGVAKKQAQQLAWSRDVPTPRGW